MSTLNDEVKAVLEQIKGVGTNLTFEGEYLADFVERLDKLVDVKGLRMDANVFKILIGESKTANPTEILSVITKATLLNASAAFVASGVCDNFGDGIEIAADAIDSGKACQKLDNLIEFTQQCTPYIRKAL